MAGIKKYGAFVKLAKPGFAHHSTPYCFAGRIFPIAESNETRSLRNKAPPRSKCLAETADLILQPSMLDMAQLREMIAVCIKAHVVNA
jgi:hypothetical protein